MSWVTDWIGTMSRLEGVGYLASLLVLCTFYMKTMIPLRCVAIGSNLAFITYGYFGRLYPVLTLHLLLLPLNMARLLQIRRLIRDIKGAAAGGFSLEPMIPFLAKETFRVGQVLFRKGDPATRLYVLDRGSVRLPEIDVSVSDSGDLIGEIGLFSPDHARTTSAICETDVVALVLTEDKVLQLFYQSPRFGFSVIRLIIGRLLADWSATSGVRRGI
jgi:CRP/FNR family transcriptional regulator, cyclic AMP receptor protein